MSQREDLPTTGISAPNQGHCNKLDAWTTVKRSVAFFQLFHHSIFL